MFHQTENQISKSFPALMLFSQKPNELFRTSAITDIFCAFFLWNALRYAQDICGNMFSCLRSSFGVSTLSYLTSFAPHHCLSQLGTPGKRCIFCVFSELFVVEKHPGFSKSSCCFHYLLSFLRSVFAFSSSMKSLHQCTHRMCSNFLSASKTKCSRPFCIHYSGLPAGFMVAIQWTALLLQWRWSLCYQDRHTVRVFVFGENSSKILSGTCEKNGVQLLIVFFFFLGRCKQNLQTITFRC